MSSVYDRLPFPLTHGYLLKNYRQPNGSSLPLPQCTFDGTNQLSRPDMKNNSRVTKSEFQDSLEVLSIKADIFIDMFMKKSKNFSILMGAGISAPLINDYASAKKGNQPAQRLTVAFCNSLRPTPAHRVLAALVNQGHMNLLDVLQQNHDGLLNLAGIGKNLPGGVKGKVNEIHGAWKDKNRPVIPMDGSLPTDLFERMLEQEKKQDCCFTIGTSLSGLNADRLIATANKKGSNPQKYPNQLGGVILSIQQVPQDYEDSCALRVYSTCDRWMLLLAAKLKLDIDFDTDYDYETEQPIKYPASARHRTTVEGIEMLKQFNEYLYGRTDNNNVDAAAPSSSSSSNNNNQNIIKNNTNKTASSTSAVHRVGQDAATVTSPPPPPQQQQQDFKILVGNYHRLVRQSDSSERNSHEWTMAVRSTEKNIIKSVVFHLHPTFKPASVRVTAPTTTMQQNNRNSAPDNRYPDTEEFTVSRLGWGTFEVKCEIEFVADKNGKTKTLTVPHDLQFEHDEEFNVVL